jgi:hypothetical protein
MTIAILISSIRSRDIMITLILIEYLRPEYSTVQLGAHVMCQENAENSAGECLPWARIAIPGNFSTRAFCKITFPVTPKDLI